MFTCEIISIGDELLIGQTINTNASWMGQKLSEIGIAVKRITTIADEKKAIISSIERAMNFADLTLVTGGLGPTHDDITKNVVTEYFGTELEFHREIYENLKKRFEAKGYKFPESNAGQAWLPRNAEIFPNKVGSAQGMCFRKHNRACVVMPGVPAEMRYIMTHSVLPVFAEQIKDEVILHHTWRTTGIAESVLFESLGDISAIEKFGKLAFLPKFTGVDIRLSVYAKSAEEAQSNVHKAGEIILKRAKKYIFSTGDTSLEQAVANELIKRKLTIAVAESCTGGLLGKKLTDVPGSSAFFLGGVITYSNDQKIQALKIPEDVLKQHGAVSEPVAGKMAENICKTCNSDVGISITGIAGPDGGTEEKPVGLVFIGLAFQKKVQVKRFLFGRERELNRERSAHAAIQMLFEKFRDAS